MPNLKDLLLIDSLDVIVLASTYHKFFLAILPSMFILALLIEYVADLEPFSVLKRTFISIIVLTSVGVFYYQSIDSSIEAANEVLQEQQRKIRFLDDLFYKSKMLSSFNQQGDDFFKIKDSMGEVLDFLTKQLFFVFFNTPLVILLYLAMFVCFFILKVSYSMVYFLGYAFIGIPCLLYLLQKREER